MRRGFAWGSGFALALVLWAAPAAAQEEPAETAPRIYRWIDENGIVHYTTDRERIPRSLRSRVATPDASGARPARRSGPDAWVAQDSSGRRKSRDVWDEGGEGGEFDPFDDRDRQREPLTAEEIAELQVERDNLDFRIAELEADISADEDAIKAMISDPNSGGPLVTGGNPEFREIAERLPKRLSELRSLRSDRAQLENP